MGFQVRITKEKKPEKTRFWKREGGANLIRPSSKNQQIITSLPSTSFSFLII